jgi:hypothetical protein
MRPLKRTYPITDTPPIYEWDFTKHGPAGWAKASRTLKAKAVIRKIEEALKKKNRRRP